MIEVLTKAFCFISIICLGMILRACGLFKKEDFGVLSKVVLKITLPAAIIAGFTGRQLDDSMFLLTLIGFGFGIFMMAVAFLTRIRRSRADRAFAMVNMSGCNVGNFVLPFAQSFLGPAGVMAASLFDMGNCFICLGGSYGIADAYLHAGEGFSLSQMAKSLLRSLSKSVPLICYLIMTVLGLLHLALPKPITDLADIIANANACMAMLMLGVGFSLQIDRSQIRQICQVLILRYAIGIGLAYLFWSLPLLSATFRQALVLLFLAPLPAAAPAFTSDMKGDFELACAINSLSIVISCALITAALIVIL